MDTWRAEEEDARGGRDTHARKRLRVARRPHHHLLYGALGALESTDLTSAETVTAATAGAGVKSRR